MRTESATGSLDLLIQVVGRGSRLVAEAVPGQSFDLLGPLGTGFPYPTPGVPEILVAGGVGVAPLIFFADVLSTAPQPHEIAGILGARTEELLCCWTEFAARCETFTAVTEDGSSGRKGLATEALAEWLQARVPLPNPAQRVGGSRGADATKADSRREVAVVYACGPLPMLGAVARLCAEHEIRSYVSLERWMGCGVGACLGCVVPSARAEGPRYVCVCKDGPVFPAADLDWAAMPA
jgi:dihydroorotate dehydrogenase electron transfer subunit